MQEKTYQGYSALGFHRIAYTEWGDDAEAPPVLCVHGLARNGRDFDPLATALQSTRRVLCPDIVGRGRSDDLADPALYGYPQYLSDMTALIARAGSAQVDWVGTSMGGIIGMLMAATPQSPIRRLVINDVGPFIPLAALQRIGAYIAQTPVFDSPTMLERYLRVIYSSFGIARDEDWRLFAQHSTRVLPDGRLRLAYDPGIAQALQTVTADVDFWALYDRIRCPTLLLRGTQSDVLPAAVAQAMTQRGPQAKLVEIPNTGHAPALIDAMQIGIVADFLNA